MAWDGFWLGLSHVVWLGGALIGFGLVLLLAGICTLLYLLPYRENTPRFSLRLLHVRINSSACSPNAFKRMKNPENLLSMDSLKIIIFGYL